MSVALMVWSHCAVSLLVYSLQTWAARRPITWQRPNGDDNLPKLKLRFKVTLKLVRMVVGAKWTAWSEFFFFFFATLPSCWDLHNIKAICGLYLERTGRNMLGTSSRVNRKKPCKKVRVNATGSSSSYFSRVLVSRGFLHRLKLRVWVCLFTSHNITEVVCLSAAVH